MSEFIEGIGNLIARLWERGHAFLWACSAAAIATLTLLFAGWLLSNATIAAAFNTYGLALAVAALVATSFAVARSIESRQKKTLFFSAEEQQSMWGHAQQPNGEVYTHFRFQMHVTNLSDSAVHLSKPRIVWPLRARWTEVVTTFMTTRHPDYPIRNIHSLDFPVMPHSRSQTGGSIILRGAVYRPGKRLTFIVSVSDHRSKRWLITFKHTKPFGSLIA